MHGTESDAAQLALKVALALTLHVHMAEAKGAKMEVRLPADVADSVPAGTAERKEILWEVEEDAEA